MLGIKSSLLGRLNVEQFFFSLLWSFVHLLADGIISVYMIVEPSSASEREERGAANQEAAGFRSVSSR